MEKARDPECELPSIKPLLEIQRSKVKRQGRRAQAVPKLATDQRV